MQYVSGDTVILSIGGSRLFPCISVSCRVIPMDTHWFVNRINSMNHVGHVLNDRTNPQCRRRCKIIITQKNTCLTSGSTNITKFFLQVMCELKLQLKCANILTTNPSIGGEGRVCTIAKWWDLASNPAFCERSGYLYSLRRELPSLFYRSVVLSECWHRRQFVIH